MPELPEVETVRRALHKYILGKELKEVCVRNPNLRWPVPTEQVNQFVVGQKVKSVDRRAKYILVHLHNGHVLMLHLGMSGIMRIVTASEALAPHDHVIFSLGEYGELRFNDARRFGSIDVVHREALGEHPRIKNLGVEPLSTDFTGHELFLSSRKLSVSVKNFLMNSRYVVGVGNIYACESLFRAGINPKRAAGKISQQRYLSLAQRVKETLSEAITQGGTTLKDFRRPEGKPGYFRISLNVYDREGDACGQCEGVIKRITQSGRSTFYCPSCQQR